MSATDDPAVADIVGRIRPVVGDLQRITAQADDMFFAFLGAPAGSLTGAARVFSEALGHVIYVIAKAIAVERGLSFSQRVAVQHQVFMQIHRQLPPPEPGLDAADEILRLMAQYNRPGAESKRDWNRFVGSYVGELERLFGHRNGTEIRRAGRLAFDVFLPQTVASTLRALEGRHG